MMGFFEYLLIISPNKEVRHQVARLKRIFASSYQCTMASRLVPHITIGNWLYSDIREAGIIATIRRFSETVSPFIATVHGLGKFDPKTIFVDISNKEKFAEISNGLKKPVNSLLKGNARFPSNAHITIARSMEPDQFERAWADWKEEPFKADFTVKEMILLRRPYSSITPSKYEAIATFPFVGKGSKNDQLELAF